MNAFCRLLFPARCVLCGAFDTDLCDNCERSTSPIELEEFDGVDQGWAASRYSGQLREVVIAYKSGTQNYATGIAMLLASIAKSNQLDADAVVPVPSSPTAIKRRGYDTVGTIAQAVAQQLGCPNLPALSFKRLPKEQIGLNPRQRRLNLNKAFQATKTVPKRILLLDDVITTGATISEAARALKIAGAQKIFVVCLCRTLGRFTV